MENFFDNNLIRKVTSALESKFIGDTIFSTEELEEISSCIKKILTKCGGFESNNFRYFEDIFYKYLIVLIVNYSKKWTSKSDDESEGNYWQRILSNIFEHDTIKSSKLYNGFEKTFEHFNHKLFISKGNKRQFKVSFLYQAFAPKESIQSFIELLLELCIEDDVINEPLLTDASYASEIASALKSRFLETISNSKAENEDIDLGGKVYAIKAGLKYAFVYDTSNVIDLIKFTLKSIDLILKSNQLENSNYYCKLIQECVNKYFQRRKKAIRTRSEVIITDTRNIFAAYKLIDETPSIVIPKMQFIDKHYENCDVILSITSNDKNISFKLNQKIYTNEIKQSIREIIIPLKDYSQYFEDEININIRLIIDDDILYDSKDTLNRKFILFKEREIKTDAKPGETYYLFLPNNCDIDDIFISTNNDSYNQKDDNTYSIYPLENDNIAQKIFFNAIKRSSQIFLKGEQIKSVSAQIKNEEDILTIYSEINDIGIRYKDLNKNKLEVIINNAPLSLSCNSEQNQKDDTYYLSNVQQYLKDGFNNIRLYSLSKSKELLCEINFVLLPNLKVEINKRIVFGLETGNIKISIDNQTTNISFDSSSDRQSYYYEKEDLTILIDTPVLYFKINDNVFYSTLSKPIWYKTLNNGTLLQIINNTSLRFDVYCNNQKMDIINNDSISLGNYSSIHSNDVNVKLVLHDKEKDKCIPLFTIRYDDTKLNGPLEVSLEDGILYLNLNEIFIGDEESKFKIEFIDEDNNIFSKQLVLTDELEFSDLADGYYKVKLFLIKDNYFDEDNLILLYKSDDFEAIGNVDKFKFDNKKLYLKNTRYGNNAKIKFDKNCIYDIHYQTTDISPVYEAKLYMGKKKYHIIFELKGKALVIYFKDNQGNLKTMNVDTSKKILTQDDQDGKKIFPIKSVYYEEEEI